MHVSINILFFQLSPCPLICSFFHWNVFSQLLNSMTNNWFCRGFACASYILSLISICSLKKFVYIFNLCTFDSNFQLCVELLIAEKILLVNKKKSFSNNSNILSQNLICLFDYFNFSDDILTVSLETGLF